MSNKLQMPIQLRRSIDRELEPGETIDWIEQPKLNVFTLLVSLMGMALFFVPWTGFSIFWMWAALGFKLPDLREGIQPQHLFALFGLPFVAIGLVMLSSPIWVWHEACQKVYLITNKRAIILSGGRTITIRSYVPTQLKDIYRREHKDGSGDVIINVRSYQDSDGDDRTEEIGFTGILNPKAVEKRLKELSDTAK